MKGNIGMKKTSFIIVIIIVVVSAISIHLITSPKVLGNMSKSYSEQITTTSDISFSGEACDRIKFSFKTDIIIENGITRIGDVGGLSMKRTIKGVAPFLIPLFFTLLVITFVPAASDFLPNLFYR